ncbi:DUF952 domain-containing protein [Calidifontibacter terrae]
MDSVNLFHLADPFDYGLACVTGEYRMSTRGRTLEEVGFVHLSYAHQWPLTRQRFYADVDTPLLLLTIDPTGLDVRPEVGNPASGELFPHLFGPLPLRNVVRVERLDPPHA